MLAKRKKPFVCASSVFDKMVFKETRIVNSLYYRYLISSIMHRADPLPCLEMLTNSVNTCSNDSCHSA